MTSRSHPRSAYIAMSRGHVSRRERMRGPQNYGPSVLVSSETDQQASLVYEGEEDIMSKYSSAQTNGVVPQPSDTPAYDIQPSSVRRTRSVADKLRILQAYDACPAGSPERGALLRREGIYTSHISKWRQQLQRRVLAGGTPARRGPQPPAAEALRDEVARLRAENAQLQARLERAETIIDVQKKVAHLLGTTLPTPPADAL